MKKPRRLVYGVGINDADYEVRRFEMVDGKRRLTSHCPIFMAWKNMMRRCYSGEYQARNPAYIGCSVDVEWHSFSLFRDWMVLQDWRGKQLDKDILIEGNKVYSPATCVFVSQALNSLFTYNKSTKGDLPVGAHWDKHKQRYTSSCRNPVTRKGDSLGCFDSPEEAHEAWRARKHEIACQYAEQETDARIALALRLRFAPANRQEQA